MLRKEIGWADGAGDGQLCPGGSACNQMGVMLARYAKCPAAKLEGNSVMGKVCVCRHPCAQYILCPV